MKIPDQFDIVVKKLYPEIKELKILDISTYTIPIIDYGVVHQNYKVSIDVFINQNFDVVPNTDDYNQKLNTTFKYTFPDMDFVYFSVNKINIPPPITNKEKFRQLFDIKEW